MIKVNRILISAALAGACMALAGYACAANNGPAGGAQMRPQRNFQQFKKEMIELHQESLAIAQKGLSCTQGANDFRAMRECHMQERSAMEQLRQKASAMFPRHRMRRSGGPNGGYGGTGGYGGRPGNGPAGGPNGDASGGAQGN